MMTMHETRPTQTIFMIILGQIPVLLTLILMIMILAILKLRVIALKSKHQDSAYSVIFDDFEKIINH